MRLIIALGNPGPEYNFTRHNFGFLALDYYFKIKGLSFSPHEKFQSLYLKTNDTIFLKPQTLYNNVGAAVLDFSNFYKIPPENLLVLSDDFHLPFGELRFRASGSAGGNNGLKSIISSLKTDNFPRLRLGTGNDTLRAQIGDVDFVLGRFTDTEKSALPTVLASVATQIDSFLQ